MDTSTPTLNISIAGTGPANPGPAPDLGWYKSAVEVTISGDGGTSGIAGAEKSYDGADSAITLPDVFTESGEGRHELAAQLRTNSGKTAEDASDFGIDTVAPELSIDVLPSAPDGDNGWYVSKPEINIMADDPDPGSGLNHLLWRWNSGPFSGEDTPVKMLTGPEGDNVLEFYATDEAHNVSAHETRRFLVDTNAPSSSVNPLPNQTPPNRLHGLVGRRRWSRRFRHCVI